jgi:hypothetical protein
MVKCGVFIAVRTELLNIILAIFCFKGLITVPGVFPFSTKKIQVTA